MSLEFKLPELNIPIIITVYKGQRLGVNLSIMILSRKENRK